ncbi:MAG TPA: Clp protease N-terminal domain-containing protein [Candidatus Dormibacteraeota bacterium]
MPDAISQTPWATGDVKPTRDAENILNRALQVARSRGVDAVEADATDVLTALLQVPGTLADRAIRELGVDPASIEKFMPPRDEVPRLPLKQVLVNAVREAQVLGHYQVDSIHLLLVMLYSDSRATSIALQGAGVTLYDLRRHLQTGAKDFLPGASDRAQSSRSAVARTRPSDTARSASALSRKPWPSLRGVVTVSPIFLGLLATMAVTGALLWLQVIPSLAGVLTILFVVAGWVTSLCVHEFGHAVVAYLGGDRSVAGMGYLSLNPVRYANVLLSVVLPIAFLLLGGIALPGGAVYINRSALRSKTWDSAVSAAGPAGTLVCGLLVALPFLVPNHADFMVNHLDFFAALAFLGFVEAFALLLNLVPIPGLDGFGIVRPWLPYSVQDAANRFGAIAILGVFIVLWYVAPIRSAFFQAVLLLTSAVQIDQVLIFLGQQLMHL